MQEADLIYQAIDRRMDSRRKRRREESEREEEQKKNKRPVAASCHLFLCTYASPFVLLVAVGDSSRVCDAEARAGRDERRRLGQHPRSARLLAAEQVHLARPRQGDAHA